MKTWQRLLSEGLGTAALLCVVIGSGIMAEQLAQGNAAVALLGNTLATVFALYVLIETLGPVSGAHFNPLVTAFVAWRDQMAIASHTGLCDVAVGGRCLRCLVGTCHVWVGIVSMV